MQLLAALLLIGILVHFWPFVLGLAVIGGIAFFYFKKSKKKRGKGRYFTDATVAYIIIKDGYGKFGITRRNNNFEHAAVVKRYNYEPINILWTATFRTREEGYTFEEYCKSQVRIVKGREWTTPEEAMRLCQIMKQHCNR